MIKKFKSYSLAEALTAASETRCLEISPGAVAITPRVFNKYFGDRPAVIVADPNTFKAAGQAVLDAFRTAGHTTLEPFIFRAPDLHAEYQYVEQLEASLRQHAAVPVAVGSGTINDVTKLSSHKTERPYMCVATAASMDGYTAYGSSITFQGAKQTFFCPAPVAVVADLDVICTAPGLLNSWGYADLLAKIPAGADWIVADALGLDSIDGPAWGIVQGRLRELLDDPAGVRNHVPAPTGKLVEGLMLGGFAIQSAKSTRAASGTEHLFSHMWDMQHHTHNGVAPSHGFKVGIGTLASTALYERFLACPVEKLDVDACCAKWPALETWLNRARESLGSGDVFEVANRELPAKYQTQAQLRDHLMIIKNSWTELREHLRDQLLPVSQLRQMLKDVGAPTEPEEIGISRERLRKTYWQASFIRRRYMGLDLIIRMGLLEPCLDQIFGPQGLWPINA